MFTSAFQMLDGDHSVAAGGTDTAPQVREIEVGSCKQVAFQLRTNGGTVEVDIVAAVGGQYSTSVWQTITVTAGAGQAVAVPVLVNVGGISKIKVKEIRNTDTTNAASGINVDVGLLYE